MKKVHKKWLYCYAIYVLPHSLDKQWNCCTYQLWAGIKGHVLMDTWQCQWIPICCLSHLCSTTQTNWISITYCSWTILPLHHFDCYLMDDFLDNGLPCFKLEPLNACCMYLYVTMLAEISDHIGEELLPQILASPTCPISKGLTNISSSSLHWP